MSTNVTDSTTDAKKATTTAQATDASPKDKGKGKATKDDSMTEEDEDEDDDDDDDDDEEEDSSEEEDEDEDMEEIDPSVILPTGRRTRGKQVDYTSEEALAKAGLKKSDMENDDEEMKDS